MHIGDRLKSERERLQMSQVQMAKLGEKTKRSQINYEQGSSYPDAAYLEALAKLGVDVQFVITGQRSILRQQLSVAISAVEEGLEAVGGTLPPDKKAELILAAYDLIAEPETPRSKVIQFIRAIA